MTGKDSKAGWTTPVASFSLLALGLAAACGTEARASAAGEPAQLFEIHGSDLLVPERSPLRSRLAVAEVSPALVRHELDVPAAAEADPARMAKVSAPLQGRVVRLLVHLGEEVRRGQPLYSFDSADLAAAQSDYLKAKSAEAQSLRAVARQRDLQEHGIGARKDLEQAGTDAEQARSELLRAGTRLQILGMEPGTIGRALLVRSPIPGRVIELSTSSGQYQNDPAAVLMVIADLTTLWVTAQVPEKDLQRVSVGDGARVQFNAWPGQRFEGRVQLIGDVLAPETRTVKVRIQIENPAHRLKPGMFARVTLQGREASELLVPPSALLVRGDQSFLYVEKAPWRFERRAVELGDPQAAGIAVTSGLAAGERIVTTDTILFP